MLIFCVKPIIYYYSKQNRIKWLVLFPEYHDSNVKAATDASFHRHNSQFPVTLLFVPGKPVQSVVKWESLIINSLIAEPAVFNTVIIKAGSLSRSWDSYVHLPSLQFLQKNITGFLDFGHTLRKTYLIPIVIRHRQNFID
jgi:hypothetical protein